MRFQTALQLIVVFWVLSSLSGLTLLADPAPYAIAQHQVSDRRTDISIYNIKTKRTVWKSRLSALVCATWTPDHRAVTIVDYSDSGTRILIWQIGRKVRVLTHLQVPANQVHDLTKKGRTAMGIIDGDLLEGDSFEQAALSPDKKRLLIRSSENMNPNDCGELWCLTLASGRFQQICPEASEAQWQGAHKVEFIKVDSRERPSRSDPSIEDIIVTKSRAIMTVK